MPSRIAVLGVLTDMALAINTVSVTLFEPPSAASLILKTAMQELIMLYLRKRLVVVVKQRLPLLVLR